MPTRFRVCQHGKGFVSLFRDCSLLTKRTVCDSINEIGLTPTSCVL